MFWHWKGSSYPPGRTEVYESEAGEAVGLVFGFGVRGPAEGGGAAPRATDKIGAWPPPAISTSSLRCKTLITNSVAIGKGSPADILAISDLSLASSVTKKSM